MACAYWLREADRGNVSLKEQTPNKIISVLKENVLFKTGTKKKITRLSVIVFNELIPYAFPHIAGLTFIFFAPPHPCSSNTFLMRLHAFNVIFRSATQNQETTCSRTHETITSVHLSRGRESYHFNVSNKLLIMLHLKSDMIRSTSLKPKVIPNYFKMIR